MDGVKELSSELDLDKSKEQPLARSLAPELECWWAQNLGLTMELVLVRQLGQHLVSHTKIEKQKVLIHFHKQGF